MGFSNWLPLSGACLINVPDSPGVYYFAIGAEVVYIGMAEGSLRERLQAHANGSTHIPAGPSWSFCFATTPTPVEDERAHLVDYRARHGRLPRYNVKVG